MKKRIDPLSGPTPESFVLTYEDSIDPSGEETAEAMDQLRPFETHEVVPGTIQVVGFRKDIEKAVSDLQAKKWNLSREKSLSSDPPHKSRIK